MIAHEYIEALEPGLRYVLFQGMATSMYRNLIEESIKLADSDLANFNIKAYSPGEFQIEYARLQAKRELLLSFRELAETARQVFEDQTQAG